MTIYDVLFQQILNKFESEKRIRAGLARCNLLAVLRIEMENIPAAVIILDRYIKKHNKEQ